MHLKQYAEGFPYPLCLRHIFLYTQQDKCRSLLYLKFLRLIKNEENQSLFVLSHGDMQWRKREKECE